MKKKKNKSGNILVMAFFFHLWMRSQMHTENGDRAWVIHFITERMCEPPREKEMKGGGGGAQ
jgi:hypothetical protein